MVLHPEGVWESRSPPKIFLCGGVCACEGFLLLVCVLTPPFFCLTTKGRAHRQFGGAVFLSVAGLELLAAAGSAALFRATRPVFPL